MVSSSAGKSLLFRVGAEDYAVPVTCVREILALSPVTKVPGSLPYVEGVMNLRGRVVPVIDLGARLGLERSARTKRTCVVVFDVGGVQAGAIVDTVLEVVTLDEDGLAAPATDDHRAPLVRSLGRARDRLVVILDVERVFESALALPSAAP